MNGASRQTIKALHKYGLCISFSALTNLPGQPASQSLERARHVAHGLHILCWDNINIKISIFVEQRDTAPAKVQSSTFAILSKVYDANSTNMQLSPMLERAQQASDVTFNADIRPTVTQRKSFQDQICIHIVDILLTYCRSFHTYNRSESTILDHPECRKMPKGHRTKQFPLRTSTIDESSVAGNIAVVNDVYINQLKMTHEELSNQAVPSINDQSTNAHMYSWCQGFTNEGHQSIHPTSISSAWFQPISSHDESNLGTSICSPWFNTSSWELVILLCCPQLNSSCM